MTVSEYEYRVQLITREVEICKRLSSNNLKMRNKGLASLKKLLSNEKNEGINVDDFNRIWNGLFNFVWMSDTPLVQEVDVENISALIHHIRLFDTALLFVRGFFSSITIQWNRISHHRTDKFLMFMRRFLRQIFFLLKNSNWNLEKLEAFSSELYSAIQILPVGLLQHLNDIYNEEIAKVSEGNIPTDALILLLKCYVDCILNMKPSKCIVNHINTNIFCALVRQFKIFIKQKAVAEFDPETFAIQEPSKESDSENHLEGNSNFDPRPGNAHVFLPYIEFDENKIVKYLEQRLTSPQICIKGRNIMTQIIQMFKSITNLRQSISQPAKILVEVDDKEKTHKKKFKKFSSFLDKACKKLQEENDDCGLSLKKLKRLRLPEKQSCNNTWTVTEYTGKPPKRASINTSQEWIVSETTKESNEDVEELNGIDNTSVPMSIENEFPVCDKSTEAEYCQHEIVGENEEGTVLLQEETANELCQPEKVVDGTKNSVLFREETNVITYEAKSSEPIEASHIKITVPQAACEGRPNLLIPGKNYLIVDFKNFETDSKSVEEIEHSVDDSNQDSNNEPVWTDTSFAKSNVDLTLHRDEKLNLSNSLMVYLPKCNPNEESIHETKAAAMPADASTPRRRGNRKSLKPIKEIEEVERKERGRKKDVTIVPKTVPEISPLKTRSRRSMKPAEEAFTPDLLTPKTRSRKSLRAVEESEVLPKKRGRKSTVDKAAIPEATISEISPLKTRSRSAKLIEAEEIVIKNEAATPDISTPRGRGRKSLKSVKEVEPKKSTNETTVPEVVPEISPLKTRSRKSVKPIEDVKKFDSPLRKSLRRNSKLA